MDAPDVHEPDVPDPAPPDAGRPPAEQPEDADAGPAGPTDTEALVRLVAPPRSAPRRVDPEDWSRSGGDDDERYHRERPPHWE